MAETVDPAATRNSAPPSWAKAAGSSRNETPAPGAEIALARACDRQEPAAWDRLIGSYRPRLLAVLHMRHVAPAVAEELVGELWGELALPPAGGGARTRIGTFLGTCSLLGWLSVILIRRQIDRWRSGAQVQSLDPETQAGAPADDDPHVRAVESEAAAEWRQAVSAAWRELPPREALALGMRYGDDLPLGPIAGLLGVGVPRASRIVQRAMARLQATLRQQLGPRWPAVADAARHGAGALGSFLATQRRSGDQRAGGRS